MSGKLSKKDRRIAELEGEVHRLALMVDVDVTFRDLQMEMRDGGINLSTVFGDESRPAMKFLAAVMLEAALGEGEFETEPPNYSACELTIKPAGGCEELHAALEVIKPGGKSSHQIRQDLEAELAALKERLG